MMCIQVLCHVDGLFFNWSPVPNKVCLSDCTTQPPLQCCCSTYTQSYDEMAPKQQKEYTLEEVAQVRPS